MRNKWQRWVVITIAVLAVAALVLPMAMSLVALAAPEEDEGDTAPELVVIGTTGLRWEDLSPLSTPRLWELVDGGASANLVARSVRSSSCPADGWLAISAGRRAADLPMEEYGACRRLAGPDGERAVPAWESYLEAAAQDGYDASPGLLGDLLADQDVSSLAVGPGAAIALAGSDGVLAGDYRHANDTASLLESALIGMLPGHDLAVVDLGSIRDHNRPLIQPPAVEEEPAEEPDPDETPRPPGRDSWLLAEPQRGEQVAVVDERVGAVVDAVRSLDEDTTILFASVADSGTVPLMQVAVAEGPGVTGAQEAAEAGGGLLHSRATRQPGMIQATDLTPTILRALDIDMPRGLVGAPAYGEPDEHRAQARVSHLADENAHAVAVRPLRGPYHSAVVLINLLLYATVTIGFNRRVLDRTASWLARRRSAPAVRVARVLRSRSPGAALRTVRAIAVTVAALPVSSYLANLLPWWRAENPALMLFGATVLIAAALATLALLPRWPDRLRTPVAVVAGVTAAVLVVDALTGTRLQVSALMGIQPEVGGRFYGFNNTSFSLFAASLILVGGICVVDPLVRAGRRWLAAGIVLAGGGVATVLVGHPSIGADFGGPPALIPGTLVLALLAAGVRLTWRRMALVLGVTGMLAVGFAVIDYLRPAEDRTHLGRFIETVLDGGLVTVIGRNLSQNLTNLFGSTLTFLAIGGIVVVVLLLTRPLREVAGSGEGGAYAWLVGDGSPMGAERLAGMLRPAVLALAVTLGIGFAVNDSGIVLPAIGVSLAVPLLVAVLTGWLLEREGAREGGLARAQSSTRELSEEGASDPGAEPGDASPARPQAR